MRSARGRSRGPRSRVALAAISLLAAVAGLSGCSLTGGHEASPAAIARSFVAFADTTIGGRDAEMFLRARTATLICGPDTVAFEADGTLRMAGHDIVIEEGQASNLELSIAAASAVSADGYFLTAVHALSKRPSHVAIECGGTLCSAPLREVWSNAARDVALVHAELAPDAWFELAPERKLAEGETVLSYSRHCGPAAGELDIDADLSSLGAYEAVEIPHDTPLRGGHSGGPAIALDGALLGVEVSTGKDTLFRRRSWFVHVRRDALLEHIEEDRRAHGTRHEPSAAQGDTPAR